MVRAQERDPPHVSSFVKIIINTIKKIIIINYEPKTLFRKVGMQVF